MKIFLILLLHCLSHTKSIGESSQHGVNVHSVIQEVKVSNEYCNGQHNDILAPIPFMLDDVGEFAPSPRHKRQVAGEKKLKLSKKTLNKIYFNRRRKKFSVKSDIRKSLSRRGYFTGAGTTRHAMKRYIRGKGRVVMSAKGKYAKKNQPRRFKKNQDIACDPGIFKRKSAEERFIKAKLNHGKQSGTNDRKSDADRPRNPKQQQRRDNEKRGAARTLNPRQQKRQEYKEHAKGQKQQVRKPYDQQAGKFDKNPRQQRERFDERGTTRRLFLATMDLDEEIDRMMDVSEGTDKRKGRSGKRERPSGKREGPSGKKEFGFRKDDRDKQRDRQQRTTWYLTKKRHGRYRTMANIPSDEDRSAMMKFIPSTRAPFTTGKRTFSFIEEFEGEGENQEQREREYKWMMYEAHEATRYAFLTKRKKKTTPLPAPKKVHSDEYMYEYKDESGCLLENYKPKTSAKDVEKISQKTTAQSLKSKSHQEDKKNLKSDKKSSSDETYSSDQGFKSDKKSMSHSAYDEYADNGDDQNYESEKKTDHSSYSVEYSDDLSKKPSKELTYSEEYYDYKDKKKDDKKTSPSKKSRFKSTLAAKTLNKTKHLPDEDISSDSLESCAHDYSYKDFKSILNDSLSEEGEKVKGKVTPSESHYEKLMEGIGSEYEAGEPEGKKGKSHEKSHKREPQSKKTKPTKESPHDDNLKSKKKTPSKKSTEESSYDDDNLKSKKKTPSKKSDDDEEEYYSSSYEEKLTYGEKGKKSANNEEGSDYEKGSDYVGESSEDLPDSNSVEESSGEVYGSDFDAGSDVEGSSDYGMYSAKKKKAFSSDVSSGSTIDTSDRHQNIRLSSSDFYKSDESLENKGSADHYDNSLHAGSHDSDKTNKEKITHRGPMKDLDYLDKSAKSEEYLMRGKTTAAPCSASKKAASPLKASSDRIKSSSLRSSVHRLSPSPLHIHPSSTVSSSPLHVHPSSTVSPSPQTHPSSTITKKPRSSRPTTSTPNPPDATVSTTGQSTTTSKLTRKTRPRTLKTSIQFSQNSTNSVTDLQFANGSQNITKKTRKPYTRKPKTTTISSQPHG